MSAQINETVLVQYERHLTQISLSPKTIASYLADLNVFVRWANQANTGEFSFVQITPDQIRSYLSYLLHDLGRAPSTVNRHLQALKKYCAYLVATNLASHNPTEEISQISDTQEKLFEPLSQQDIEMFLSASGLTRQSIAKRDLAIMSLLVKAGLRVTEVVNLKVDDVVFDYPGVHLTVLDSRGQYKRDVPLSPDVCRSLTTYLSVRPNTVQTTYLFLTQEDTALSSRTVQRIVSRCAREADLTGVTAQKLRRTYAYHLWQETEDLKLVSQRLGHQSLQITQRYLGE